MGQGPPPEAPGAAGTGRGGGEKVCRAPTGAESSLPAGTTRGRREALLRSPKEVSENAKRFPAKPVHALGQLVLAEHTGASLLRRTLEPGEAKLPGPGGGGTESGRSRWANCISTGWRQTCDPASHPPGKAATELNLQITRFLKTESSSFSEPGSESLTFKNLNRGPNH